MTNNIPLRSVSGPPPPAMEPSPQYDYPSRDLDEGGADLMRLVWHAWEHKWLIAGVLLITLGVGLFKYFSTPPQYSASALMQIETNEAGLPALQQFEQYDAVFGGSVSIAAEIEIMKSRTVMADVAERLKLDILASPRYEPWIGAAIARRYTGPGVAKPWFGKDQYAWGGEQIEVQSLLVPNAFLGQAFWLVAEQAGRFRLLDDTGAELLQGSVGTRAETELAGGGSIVLFVSRLKARPGTEFMVRKVSLEDAAAGLGAAFSAIESPSYSGILRVGFTASNANQAATTLNAILDNYQRRNVERKGEEADKTLEFLEKQLPPLKTRLDAAEGAYNDFLRENGTIDITRETQNVLTSVMEIENELFGLEQERETLRARFKPTHPKIRSIDGLMSTLRDRLSDLEQQTKTLPEMQQTVLRLSRDVEVNSALYSRLINAMQELRIAKAGTVGNARIIDYALPPKAPIAPNLRKTLAISTLIGLFIGLAIVYIRFKLRRGIEDPDEIEQNLGISVFGSIPFSEAQQKLSKQIQRRKSGLQPLVLRAPEDQAVESIRSLRTSLHFLLLEAGNTTLLVTGPTPGVGKSFLCVNLALVLGQAGKRVLLIDADMRKGHLNRVLGTDVGIGLSEFITGNADRDQVLTQFEAWRLDFIATGARPPNPSELLMHERLSRFVGMGRRDL
jgi:tyrosine-protein kinase Etk/Wzc